jgi:hypothetical protein
VGAAGLQQRALGELGVEGLAVEAELGEPGRRLVAAAGARDQARLAGLAGLGQLDREVVRVALGELAAETLSRANESIDCERLATRLAYSRTCWTVASTIAWKVPCSRLATNPGKLTASRASPARRPIVAVPGCAGGGAGAGAGAGAEDWPGNGLNSPAMPSA